MLNPLAALTIPYRATHGRIGNYLASHKVGRSVVELITSAAAIRHLPSLPPGADRHTRLRDDWNVERAPYDPREVGLAVRFLNDRRARSQRLKP